MRLIGVAGALALFYTLTSAITGCGRGKKQESPPAPKVTVAAVMKESVPMTMQFSGTVKAVKAVEIVPRVSGYIDERYFEEGAYVDKGDPLYLIDPRPFQAKLDSAVAQLERDQANLVYWQSEAKRYTELAKSGAGSVEKKDTAVAREYEAKAAVDKDKADIESARLNLGFTRISAPFRGRIQDTKMNIGALVSQQKSVLTTLVEMDPIYVIFNVTRRELYRIQELQREGVVPKEWNKIKVAVLLPDGSKYKHRGFVNYVSSRIDPATDSLMVRGKFPNPAEKEYEVDLVAGQFVPVKMVLGDNPRSLLIPKEALVEDQAGAHVFVVGEDNKVEVRPVEVADSYKDQWVVKKGLKEGERVVVTGVQKVKPGMSVDPAPMPPKKEGE